MALTPPPTKLLLGLWPFPLLLSPSLPAPTYCHKQAPIRQLSHLLQPTRPEHCQIRLCIPAPPLEARKHSSAPEAVSALQQYRPTAPPRAAFRAGFCTAGPASPNLPAPACLHVLHSALPPAAYIRPAHTCSEFIFSFKEAPGSKASEMLLEVLPTPFPRPQLSNSHALKQIQQQQIPCDKSERRPDLSLHRELRPKKLRTRGKGAPEQVL